MLYSTAHIRLLSKGLILTLAVSDWAAIVGYLLITLFLGLYFRGRSGKSTEDYFVSGRNVSWWLAGTSMVATTFAADTPLAVTGLVYANGVAGNWLWWSFLPSGMMTVFLFARLWRRSGLITDVQFAEMRYAGKPAAFLRGFRAVYLGLLMNCLILGWVTKAMVNIISTSLGVSDAKALGTCVFFLMPFTGIYVSLGGLWGVLWTDLEWPGTECMQQVACSRCSPRSHRSARLPDPAQATSRRSYLIFRAVSRAKLCGLCR